jgi:hypothetical protein
MSFKGWCGGVNNNPYKNNLIFSIRSLYNTVLPNTPQSLSRIPALVEGSLCTIVLGERVGRILHPVTQGLRLCHSQKSRLYFGVYRSGLLESRIEVSNNCCCLASYRHVYRATYSTYHIWVIWIYVSPRALMLGSWWLDRRNPCIWEKFGNTHQTALNRNSLACRYHVSVSLLYQS